MSTVFHTIKIDGSNKTEADRLDGTEIKFPTVNRAGSLEEAVEVLRNLSENEKAGVHFLADAIEFQQNKDRKSWLNAKAREDGKTYTRDEIKKLPQRSEVIGKEEVEKFGQRWKIGAPKATTTSKLKAAEAAARREAEKAEASTRALLETLADLPKKKAEERLESLIAAGIVPEGTSLD